MNDLPIYISLTFFACVLASFGFIYYAILTAAGPKSNIPLFAITFMAVWIFVTSLMTINGFFQDYEAMPPRLIMMVLILVIFIVSLFLIPATRNFLNQMPITTLTYIHIIRVPVEIVLWWLFINGVVAESMTFEGVNFDILSGISAPFAGLFLVGLKSKSNIAAIIWNLLALGLLVNIVARAILATPYFYDPAVYDQPNIAVFYFPYVLLPLFVVPAVLFSHLVSLYQLIFLKEPEED